MISMTFGIMDVYDFPNKVGKPELICAMQNKQNQRKHLPVLNDHNFIVSQNEAQKLISNCEDIKIVGFTLKVRLDPVASGKARLLFVGVG